MIVKVHMKDTRLLILLLLLGLTACGGGSDSADPNASSQNPIQISPSTPDPAPTLVTDTISGPFGLMQREPLANLNLPQGGVAATSYTIVNAFPNISFNDLLFAASVPGEQRMVYIERAGRVKVIQNSDTAAESRQVLDITQRVASGGGEQGLLGIALHPNFTQNRALYLHYTRDNPLSSVVSEFLWNASSDTIDASSEKIILQFNQPFTNHNGGGLLFGPDGNLYIASGDGGDGGDPFENGQNLGTLLGKVLRIKVHPEDPALNYSIPQDNPFANDANARPEIYAYGFRNPFRFSFDRLTGELWLGDVGQEHFEEVNKVVSGGNYGWRYFEAEQQNNELPAEISRDNFIFPVHSYDHSQGRSVIGGVVYHGSALPGLSGRYIYGDYFGSIWALTANGNEVVSNEFIAELLEITSFVETSDGELLITTRYSGIYKLSPDSGVSENLPERLSETGIFSDLSSLTPSQGFIPYLPNHAFWSDGVDKKRWIGVPVESSVSFSADDWTFPVGSVAVKHFSYNQVQGDPATARRLETRVFIHGDQGWKGFTYRWNDEQSDANLLRAKETTTLSIMQNDGSVATQQYDFPSQTECLQCHTQVEGWTLGLTTAQLNGDFTYGQTVDNQIRSWNNIGMFDYDVGLVSQYTNFYSIQNAEADVAARARAYLDVNCSVCHQPGGPTGASMDFRATTALEAMNAIDWIPTAGDLGITDARIIARGSKERSVLWQRIQRLDDKRMPPLSTHVVDQRAVELLGQWIDSL